MLLVIIFRRISLDFNENNKVLQDMISKKKIVPECPFAYVCGGCDLQELSYKDQLEYKQIKTEQLLGVYGKVNPIIGMKEPTYYRNKVHATFANDNGKVISGMYERDSHKVVNISNCMIQDERANSIIKTITEMLQKSRIEIFNEDTGEGLFRHVLIRTAHKTGEILVVFVVASSFFPSRNKFVKELMKKHPEITTIVQNINNRDTSVVLGFEERTLRGKGFIEDQLCGLRFRISPQSFYQINSMQTKTLYEKAMELADIQEDEIVFDAYSGIGTIGIIASKYAKEVIGVEINGQAVYDSIKNSRRNKVNNARFYKGDAGDFMRKMADENKSIDTVFLDPPREGSDEKFLSSLLRIMPNKIVYISCNPETQAEDIRYLAERKYRVKEIQPIDMFPHTTHVECVALIQRETM